MILPGYSMKGVSGNGAKSFQCLACGALITRSDHLITVGGTNRHVFVNPAGIEFDFKTFNFCTGAMAPGEPTEEHTWFSGYSWRFAFCRRCGQHLGWYYEDVSKVKSLSGFWGILISRVFG
jgi:hypothetical protein